MGADLRGFDALLRAADLAPHGRPALRSSSTSCWAATRRSSSSSRCSSTRRAVTVVQQVFVTPLNFVRESMSSATNLSVFLPMLDESSFLAKFFGTIDLFLIWWVVVLSIGLGVLYRRKTGPIAVGLFVVLRHRGHHHRGGHVRPRGSVKREREEDSHRCRDPGRWRGAGRGQRLLQTRHGRRRPGREAREAQPGIHRVGVGQDPGEDDDQHQRQYHGPGREARRGRRRRGQARPVPAADRPAEPAHGGGTRRGRHDPAAHVSRPGQGAARVRRRRSSSWRRTR